MNNIVLVHTKLVSSQQQQQQQQQQQKNFIGQNSAGRVISCALVHSVCFANQWISQDSLNSSSQSERSKMDIHWFGI